MHRTTRLVAATGATALALAGCSLMTDESVPADELEQGVAGLLEEQVGQPVESVDCEDDLVAEVGSEVRCTLEASDGSTIGLTVTADSIDGDQVNYQVQVDEKPMENQPSGVPSGNPTGEPSAQPSPAST
ncbi:uncharacterized protein DUF4333 [Haloactinopolyspora alba]|uniref:Uncharacterized protein DUF4333 n=1 Tax=Haloactinopolyspora alba TaxID=648780 RepID=A0A2P8DYT6_9ACTN|nr:DUF4333 domain-containing protein [Haloactinopolyspora alba]PSL02379.1 uncharacterized protein DUF4333 [Haloactinopolyspora alba]